MGAGHGLDLDFVLMHHHHGALGLLTHHVTGAERAHGALGGLDQEGAARVGRHGHGDGAVQQAHLAIGGREVQVHPAARVQQQLAAVRQYVAAAFAGGRGGVGGDVVEG